MQKDGPLFPGVIERSLEFGLVGYDPEAALGIGMAEGIGVDGNGIGLLRLAAGRLSHR